MQSAKKTAPPLRRRSRIVITMSFVLGTIALLLYFELSEIIYIGSAISLIILLIVVAFTDLENIRSDAAEEVYRTNRSKETFPDGKAVVRNVRSRSGPTGLRSSALRGGRHTSQESI